MRLVSIFPRTTDGRIGAS